MTNIFGVVETQIANTSSTIYLDLYSSGGAVDVTNNVGAPDIDTALVGTALIRNDVSTGALNLVSSATPAISEFGARTPQVAIDMVADADQTTYIRAVISTALASGEIDWHCQWEPLSDNGFLATV